MYSTKLVLNLEESEGNAEIKKNKQTGNWQKKGFTLAWGGSWLLWKNSKCTHWEIEGHLPNKLLLLPTKLVTTTIDMCGLIRRQKYSLVISMKTIKTY